MWLSSRSSNLMNILWRTLLKMKEIISFYRDSITKSRTLFSFCFHLLLMQFHVNLMTRFLSYIFSSFNWEHNEFYIQQLKRYFFNLIKYYLNKDRDKSSGGRQYSFYLLPQSHSLESHNLRFYRFPIMNPGG